MTGSVLELPTDHPGVSDPVYVARRNHIADLSADLELGTRPAARRVHAGRERRLVDGHSALTALHAEYAVAEYRSAAAVLDLPTDQVPQLADVSDRLTELTGWRLCAVPGLRVDGRVLRCAGRSLLPVFAIRAPRVGAVLHARARRHPRTDRPRQLAGLAANRRRSTNERARCRAAHRSSSRRSARPGVLVHARVRCGDGSTAHCAPTALVC